MALTNNKNVLLIYFTIPVPFLLIPFSLFVPVPSLHSQRTLQNRFLAPWGGPAKKLCKILFSPLTDPSKNV